MIRERKKLLGRTTKSTKIHIQDYCVNKQWKKHINCMTAMRRTGIRLYPMQTSPSHPQFWLGLGEMVKYTAEDIAVLAGLLNCFHFVHSSFETFLAKLRYYHQKEETRRVHHIFASNGFESSQYGLHVQKYHSYCKNNVWWI